ncbi:MAG: helix-turn-helix transcriptional regulator [Selenomonadaceae bacterium]|nr:helix-turn-helix transcriptional regulator [Selenomonadaceae bacterium]
MLLPLKELRESKEMTQAELSKALKISPSTVGMWEQGRRQPDCEMLKRIADYFGVTADYLLGRDVKGGALSKTQSTLLINFDMLNSDGQNLIMGMLSSLKLSHPKKRKKSSGIVQNNKINNNYGVVGGNFNSEVTIG